MEKLLYITPHLSTGGAPQYLLKKLELLIDEFDIHVVEYQDLGIFRVQKDKIISILKNPLTTLGERKEQLLDLISDIKPDIIHFEEMPELFDISDEITRQIYRNDRTYRIFETSHDSSFEPASKRFYPDKFLFCSDNQLLKFRSVDTPACVIEYPEYNYKRKNREKGLQELGLDPNYKHVLNVGLFTSRKNQGEIFHYAEKLKDEKIQFHFVGNQAPNFESYWKPLMENKPENCVIWGERSDVENFYSCMDLFLFTSRGHAGDKETNPLVLKEALSWNIPILMHKIDSYLDKYDKKATFLSPDTDLNHFKILHKLNISSDEINCDVQEDLRININFSDRAFEKLFDKLICIYDSKNDLCIMRTKVLAQHMFAHPSGHRSTFNGFTIKIFDAPHNYFSNVHQEDRINEHHLLYQQSETFERNLDDVKIHDEIINVKGIKDDPSAWFTMNEVFISKIYDKINVSKNDTVLDIGGHFGFFSLFSLDKGAKEIYALEPGEENFKYFCMNTGQFDNIKPFNLALSDKIENKKFIITGPSATNSFHKSYNNQRENPVSMGVQKSENVNCIDFNTFVRINNINRIDAMKMDCEGSEWDILPTISDDFLKYKMRKLSIELHQFNLKNKETQIERCKKLVQRFENLNYEVEYYINEHSNSPDEKYLGQLWAKRYPKIKVVHMLCTTTGSREQESIKHISKLLDVSDWVYEQSMNKRYTELPPKETCARPDVVQMEPGDYKLTGAHYGNYMAHRRVFEKHMTDDYDAVLFCECDAIFIKPPEEVFKIIIDSYDDLLYNNLNYMSFGKRIPDWHYDEYEDFGVTDRMSEAHCYLIPTERRNYFVEKFKNSGWDTYDLWLNNTVFPDKLSGITKEPFSIQCSGESYLDKSHKDGTTLLKDGDITYEL